MTILTNLNLSQNELQNAVLHRLAAAPENPVLGQIYFDTTNQSIINRCFFWLCLYFNKKL